jgi:quercetin dioxygenase-like cupin family protein
MNPIQTFADLNSQEPREIKVLVSDERRKVVRITLRNNDILDDHSTKTPLLIYCVQGDGILRVGGSEVALSPGILVPLDANVVHAVEARPALTLLLTLFR